MIWTTLNCPVILVKILLIQRLFGIKSLRRTIKEIETTVLKKPLNDIVSDII
ncbi:hypothetical protein ISP05_01280 [Staphylococcus kloosii]|nr:hypothetical protein [Staphylococcus kloosii]